MLVYLNIPSEVQSTPYAHSSGARIVHEVIACSSFSVTVWSTALDGSISRSSA